ncbi:F-box protein CPR1-like isoform X4 [Camellia sinensis]|uniref:F-box protein CPR1-like isoform X4 n=1 Tax=Camellia sinensis TaxID=4442 RepID=UPI001036E5C3|nr:F-box protein CPR1-like isoform X4 [Camellia sinensis]
MLREDGPHALIAFDLGAEEYRMVSLPECGAVDFYLKFEVLNGCLCVRHYYLKKGVDLWVMKEYGVKESWTKLICIEQSNIRFAIYLEPLPYSKNDHFGTTVCLGSLVPLDGGRPDDSKDQATKDKKKEKVIRSYDFLSKEVQAAAVSHC